MSYVWKQKTTRSPKGAREFNDQQSNPMNLRKLNSCFLGLGCLVFCCQNVEAQIDGIRSFTEPYRTIDLAAGEMGTLFEVRVQEGDQVVAGQIVARLDEKVLEKSRAIAANSMNAKGKLHSAHAELKMQAKRLEKIKGLFQRKHASQNELERAEGQLEIARAQLEAVEDELRIRSLEFERIEAQIEQRRLRSPIGGVVTEIYKDEGEFVSANDPTVATVVQLDPLLVIFLVPQDTANRFQVNQSVDLLIGPDKQAAEGSIEHVFPIDAQSGTRRIKVRIPNENLSLESGEECFLNSGSISTVAFSQQE